MPTAIEELGYAKEVFALVALGMSDEKVAKELNDLNRGRDVFFSAQHVTAFKTHVMGGNVNQFVALQNARDRLNIVRAIRKQMDLMEKQVQAGIDADDPDTWKPASDEMGKWLDRHSKVIGMAVGKEEAINLTMVMNDPKREESLFIQAVKEVMRDYPEPWEKIKTRLAELQVVNAPIPTHANVIDVTPKEDAPKV